MKNKLILLALLLVLPFSSHAVTPANTTNTNGYNTWFNDTVGLYFGNYPNASIVYDGTNLVIDVTHGGGTVVFPHGLAGTVSPVLTSAHILVGNSSNVGTDVPMSGDVSITNTGVTTVARVTASSTITSTSPTGVGAHILSAANTSCNTTCTGGGCLIGWDTTAGEVAVECTNATADKCLCMH